MKSMLCLCFIALRTHLDWVNFQKSAQPQIYQQDNIPLIFFERVLTSLAQSLEYLYGQKHHHPDEIMELKELVEKCRSALQQLNNTLPCSSFQTVARVLGLISGVPVILENKTDSTPFPLFTRVEENGVQYVETPPEGDFNTL